MPEKNNKGEGMGPSDPFLEWARTGTRPVKGAGQRVSSRSVAPLEINLKRDIDHALRAAERPFAPDPSARQVDGRTGRRIKQGKIRPEGRLDLHGYRYESARTALRRFVAAAAAEGKRCVLVVTGKGDLDLSGQGGGSPSARGVIRRAVPGWLNESPLDRMVLRAETAQTEDGGTGALYLYLRRDR